MATVPSGWAYWDASAGKRLTAGQTMPTPAAGDEYFGVTSSGDTDYSKLLYRYFDARTLNYSYYSEDITGITYTIPAGWAVINSAYTMLNATVLSSIAGKNVVSVYIGKTTGCAITSISLPSTIVAAWFEGNTTIKTITGTISSAMKYFICKDATSLISVPSMANASSIIPGNRMFENCKALTTVPALPPNLKSLYYAFSGCTSIRNIPAIPSTVIDEAYMCNGCTSLENAPINNSTVARYIQGAFTGCSNLVDASNFNIPASAEFLWRMFQDCSRLTMAPTVRGNNADCNRIFQSCTSLVNPPSFEGTYSNMASMFYKCSSLKTAPIIPPGSQSLGWAFAECSSLEEMPYIPSTIKDLHYCFYKCTSLTNISIRLNNSSGSSFNSMFAGCTNLTGIIFLDNTYGAPCTQMFYDTTKTIVIGGYETPANTFAAQSNNGNVYRWLNASYPVISAVKTNADGVPDDEGENMQVSIDFTCPVIDNSKLYVPKVYIKNNQQIPSKNWVLTYKDDQDTEIIKEIQNSTDISAARIEANDMVAAGNFKTLFPISDMQEGAVFTVLIPTSNSNVALGWNNADAHYTIGTFYWNGSSGSAIYTGDTYIWDALPDGSAFKLGGPIIEDKNETGFIVGNEIDGIENQYPSTFNGPVTFNSLSYLLINDSAEQTTDEGKLYSNMIALGWL